MSDSRLAFSTEGLIGLPFSTQERLRVKKLVSREISFNYIFKEKCSDKVYEAGNGISQNPILEGLNSPH